MHGFWQQIQYAFRLFLKSPGLTVIAVLILGIGIGANAAIFSLLDAVLLNPLPFPRPDRLSLHHCRSVTSVNSNCDKRHFECTQPSHLGPRDNRMCVGFQALRCLGPQFDHPMARTLRRPWHYDLLIASSRLVN